MGNKSNKLSEEQIKEYLLKKTNIIDNHINQATTPTNDEIQLVAKLDIDIFEFLTDKLKKYENDKIKKDEKYENYIKMKTDFENLNYQWEELLGYNDEIAKMKKENKEARTKKIEKNELRDDILLTPEEEEEEVYVDDDPEDFKEENFYCNGSFYEKTPVIKGEHIDKFDSFINPEQEKNKYPFDF